MKEELSARIQRLWHVEPEIDVIHHSWMACWTVGAAMPWRSCNRRSRTPLEEVPFLPFFYQVQCRIPRPEPTGPSECAVEPFCMRNYWGLVHVCVKCPLMPHSERGNALRPFVTALKVPQYKQLLLGAGLRPPVLPLAALPQQHTISTRCCLTRGTRWAEWTPSRVAAVRARSLEKRAPLTKKRQLSAVDFCRLLLHCCSALLLPAGQQRCGRTMHA